MAPGDSTSSGVSDLPAVRPRPRRIRTLVGITGVIVALIWASSTPGARPQSPAPNPPAQTGQAPAPPVFRGGTTFVYVDAYPRRDGHVVEGLTADDFQVFEDGKPQKVETFEFVRSAPVTPDGERLNPVSKEDGDRQAADPHNRVFVVYLDVGHITQAGSRDARQPIIDFLNRTIAATDLFTVATPDIPVRQLTFYRRTEVLESELANNLMWGEARNFGPTEVFARTDAERALGQSCMQTQGENGAKLGDALILLLREDDLMRSLEDLMRRLGDLRDERKNVLFMSEGWVPQPPATGLLNLLQSSMPSIGIGPGGRLGLGGSVTGRASDTLCSTQGGRLAGIDFERRFRDLLSLANQSNVSFYPVDLQGLRTTAPLGGPIDTLRTLAENTDGAAIVATNDLSAGVRRVADDLAAYYLLGYYSANTAADGKFRKIEVKVIGPRVSMSARRGYLAPTAQMQRAAADVMAKAAAGPSAFDDAIGALARIRPDAEMNLYAVSAPDGLDVVAEIASRELGSGRWLNGATLKLTIAGPSGDPTVASGKIDAGARSTLVHVPLPQPDRGPWKVTARLTAEGENAEERLDVPALAGRGANDALVGPAVVSRATPSPRSVLRPVADFQFRRTERLHIEWPELKTLDQRTARLLDRRGQALPLNAALAERVENGQTTVVVDLNLAALAEGDYIIELTAGSGAVVSRQLVAFRIGR
ncbi:MAG: VWA domain-containing protein [Acidobacteriota bacterium]